MRYTSALIRKNVVSSHAKFFILSPYNSQQRKPESEKKEERENWNSAAVETQDAQKFTRFPPWCANTSDLKR